MKNIKIYFFLSLFITSTSNSMETEYPADITNFVKGPLTKLSINEEVWTVSILNLKQRKKIKEEFVNDKWKEKFPNIPIPKEEPTPLVSNNFQEMKDDIEETGKFNKYINKLDQNELINKLSSIKSDVSKEKFIEDKWKEKFPNIPIPKEESISLVYQNFQEMKDDIEETGEFNKYINNIKLGVLKEKFIEDKWKEKFPNTPSPSAYQKLQDIKIREFNEYLRHLKVNKLSNIERDVHSAIVFEGRGNVNFEEIKETLSEVFAEFLSDSSLNTGIKNFLEKNFPKTQQFEQVKTIFTSSDIKNLFEENLPETPQFEPDTDGTWTVSYTHLTLPTSDLV